MARKAQSSGTNRGGNAFVLEINATKYIRAPLEESGVTGKSARKKRRV